MRYSDLAAPGTLAAGAAGAAGDALRSLRAGPGGTLSALGP